MPSKNRYLNPLGRQPQQRRSTKPYYADPDDASSGSDLDRVKDDKCDGFQLPVEMFTDGALAYLTQRDDGFEIVDG